MEEPTAKVSTCVTSPTISKYIRRHLRRGHMLPSNVHANRRALFLRASALGVRLDRFGTRTVVRDDRCLRVMHRLQQNLPCAVALVQVIAEGPLPKSFVTRVLVCPSNRGKDTVYSERLRLQAHDVRARKTLRVV